MTKTFDFDFLQNNLKEFRIQKISKGKILACVSGGVDSVVMLDHLVQISQKLKDLEVQCAYFHHGKTGNKKTDSYRNRAQKFVAKLCADYCVTFHTNQAGRSSSQQSEDQMRKTRWEYLSQISGTDWIATAHHSDDLAETLIMRLIRGTGAQGLQTLQFLEQNKLRPLIRWTKEDVLKYAHIKKLSYIEDPSNKSNRYFRNWIRNKWLKELESYQKGSSRAFKNSLLKVREDLLSRQDQNWSLFVTPMGIERQSFLFLNKAEQRAILATYLRTMNVENYKTTHIDEILKRLDSPQKNITFELLKCIWTIDTKHISAKKKSGLG